MCFEYGGYTVHRIGLRRYLIIGPSFRGYEASESAARKMIDGIISGRCDEQRNLRGRFAPDNKARGNYGN